VVAPEPLLVRLRLEPVDVADVVPALKRCGLPVPHHDPDVVRYVVPHAAELVVDVLARAEERAGLGRSR
jgi:hypothetical protein